MGSNGMELALFDFDHTVTTCDTYGRFLRRVATAEQLAQAWWKVGPWLAAYKLKLISAERIRARVTRLTFSDRHSDDITTLAAGFSREFLPEVVRPEMLEQIRWHKEQQHTVVIVSGSLDLYLRPWCEQLGLQLICNRLESQDGRLTGRYAGGDCGPRKVEHIRRQFDLSRYVRIHAYGDSSEDKPMLALAHERWFRGKPLKSSQRAAFATHEPDPAPDRTPRPPAAADPMRAMRLRRLPPVRAGDGARRGGRGPLPAGRRCRRARTGAGTGRTRRSV